MKITKNKTKYLVLVTCLILGGIGSSQVQAKELDPNKPKTEQVEKQNTEKDKEKDKEKAPAGDFVFSMVQPYNKDIKILNSDDSLFKEYFVRQDTTITLPEVYSDDSNSDVVFKAKEAKKNNQSQVQIFSQLEPKKQQEVADEEKAPEKTEKKQKISWVSIAVGVLGLLALGFVFFKFKKSSKKVEDEENLGNDFESEENEDFDEDFEDGSEENEELDEDFDWNTDEDFENTSDEFEDEVSDKDLEDLEAQVKKKKLKRKQQLEQQLRELDSKLN